MKGLCWTSCSPSILIRCNMASRQGLEYRKTHQQKPWQPTGPLFCAHSIANAPCPCGVSCFFVSEEARTFTGKWGECFGCRGNLQGLDDHLGMTTGTRRCTIIHITHNTPPNYPRKIIQHSLRSSKTHWGKNRTPYLFFKTARTHATNKI